VRELVWVLKQLFILQIHGSVSFDFRGRHCLLRVNGDRLEQRVSVVELTLLGSSFKLVFVFVLVALGHNILELIHIGFH